MGNWLSTFVDHYWESLRYLQGGGAIMAPLLVVSIWMWVLIFKKLAELYWHSQRKTRHADSTAANMATGTSWQSEIIHNFTRQRTFDPELDRKLVQKLVKQHSTGLEKHVHTILVLASSAPLLGLLGTVTGMITTFEVISHFGTGNARALASGISEALITTQSGLIVAIPGLFMGNFIRRRVLQCQARMQRFGLNLARSLEKSRP